MQELHFNGHTAPVSLPSISKSGRNSLLHLYYSNKSSSSRTGEKKQQQGSGKGCFQDGDGREGWKRDQRSAHHSLCPGAALGAYWRPLPARLRCTDPFPREASVHGGAHRPDEETQRRARTRSQKASLAHHSLLSVQYVHTQSLLHRLKPLRKRAS